MKALTLTQPWASLVAGGAKQVETRSWSTSHRGWLAIHAGSKVPMEAYKLLSQEPFRGTLRRLGISGPGELPLGVVVAVCQVVNCVQIGPGVRVPDGEERAFGDYREGRYMWLLMHVVALREPVPAKGLQGLWEWAAPAWVLDLVRGRL